MNFYPSKCKSQIIDLAHSAGFFAIGMAKAEPVDENVFQRFQQWLSDGRNAGMTYLENYPDIRRDPRLLLDGAKTVISLAMSYYHTVEDGENPSNFALYAHGDDYHEVLRKQVKPIIEYIETIGGKTRFCVDTAPILERFWAVKSGIGFIGRNSMLIIPNAGSYFFLCEIITTIDLPADAPCTLTCGDCMACETHCPGKSLADRQIDARRCHSYLTIEHRGDLPQDTKLSGIYGCDICQKCCPHNSTPPSTPLQQFHIRPAIASITLSDIMSLTQPQFSAIFSHSAIKRTKLAGLRRNAELFVKGI